MVLTFGELLLRLASTEYSRLFQRSTLEATFCGAEANVAVSLANYNIKSKYLTVIPDNDVGLKAIESLRSFGVDVSDIIFKSGRMGLFYLEKGASQRASKVIYDRVYSSFSSSQPEDYNWDLLFRGVEWFHFSGITPALSDNLKQICINACKTARKKGVTVSCDLNYRAKLWSPEEAQITMTKLMPYVDVCFANEEDAEKSLGIIAKGTDVQNANIERKGYEDVTKQICERFQCKYVAISLRKSYSASHNGWAGMLYNHATKKACFSTEYDIQIVDRVGSGDSFSAGIIYGLLKGETDQNTLEFATAASCLKHSIEGDFNRVTVSEVKSLINNRGNGRVDR